MQHRIAEQAEPWHRNPWVWLLIAIPALTVAGCMLTIYLAIANPDYLVQDNAVESLTPENAARDAIP
ncbi:MAG: FixH family protein [Gammaproteobacteria bacterium]|nr:FixH family protein [Gammaproteobacteria bacterium]MDH4314184.1 FixH family protein [Gammaproteobacteria bacterium]MDH5215938.1 FixH family protein [Gammaproteobacteria bacterium]